MQAYPLHSVLESYDDPVTNAAIPNAQKCKALFFINYHPHAIFSSTGWNYSVVQHPPGIRYYARPFGKKKAVSNNNDLMVDALNSIPECRVDQLRMSISSVH